MSDRTKKDGGNEEKDEEAGAPINKEPDSKEPYKAAKKNLRSYLRDNIKKNFDKNAQVDEAMEKTAYEATFTSADVEKLIDMVKWTEAYLKEIEKELKGCKEEEKADLEVKKKQLVEFLDRTKKKEKQIKDDIDSTGNNPEVLTAIAAFNGEKYKHDQPELDFLVPKLYKLDLPPLSTEGGDRMIRRYIFCWIALQSARITLRNCSRPSQS